MTQVNAVAPLLEVRKLVKEFPIYGGVLRRQVASVKAVTDVSFEVRPGETLGIVGESGCGKSTLARAIIRLYPPTSGTVHFAGRDMAALTDEDRTHVRAGFQMVFQDPYSSMNPRMPIRRILEEPLELNRVGTPAERRSRTRELIELVGMRAEHLNRYPHEFSGGQRQRICIARALALRPQLIIADEPVSALDVSIQSQILNLMVKLQRDLGLTFIFISHDLGVVRYVADRVAVMYLGRFMEMGSAEQLFASPKHPYTQTLLNAVPIRDPRQRDQDRLIVSGDVPSPVNPPTGCVFHSRCPFVGPTCRTKVPPFAKTSDGRLVACHMVTDPTFRSDKDIRN